MIKVSFNAQKKVSQLMQEEGFNPHKDFVRVGVKSGGCSGLSYDLSFDSTKSEQDRLFEDNAVKILVDKKACSTCWELPWNIPEASTERVLFLIIPMHNAPVVAEKVFPYD